MFNKLHLMKERDNERDLIHLMRERDNERDLIDMINW